MTNKEQENKLVKLNLKEIPDRWKLVGVGDIGNIITGSTPSTSNESFYNGKWLFISPADIGLNKYIADSIKKLSDEGIKVSRSLPVGTVVVTCIGELGKVGITQKVCATNQQINAVICNNDIIINEYFYYVVQQYKGQLNTIAGLQVVPIVNKTQFSKIILPLPMNLSEQTKIADVLSNIDNTIEKTKKIIEKYRNIKNGLAWDLFSGKIRFCEGKTYKETEYKDSEIGFIPKDKDICTIRTYISYQKSGLSRRITSEDIGIPVLTSGNLVDSKLNVDELKYWFQKDPQGANVEDYILDNEDILLCFINSVEQMGKVCIFYDIGRPCIYTTNLFRIKASEYAIPKFLFYLLESFYVQREIKKITKPAINQASFTKEDFFKIRVPFYELEEQREIVKILSCADSKIEKELSHLNKLNQIKQGLMQDLLTGKVRVKVEEDGDE